MIGFYSAGAMGSGDVELWSPANLALPPRIWLNDDSSVTDAGGGACSQWDDISGNARHFSQVSAGARPVILAAELNGRRVIRFDGTTDSLRGGSGGARGTFGNVAAGWAVLVYRKRSTDGSASTRTLFASTEGNAANSRFVVNAQGTAAIDKPSLYVRRLDADPTATLTAASAGGTAWRIMLAAMDWANGDGFIYLDGSLDASNLALTSSGNTSNTQSYTDLGLGAYMGVSSTVNFADVDVAELIVGSGASLPSPTEIDKLFGYAAHRWGLAGNLGAGHPYKSAPP